MWVPEFTAVVNTIVKMTLLQYFPTCLLNAELLWCPFEMLLYYNDLQSLLMCIDSTPGGLKENVLQQKRQLFHFDLWFCLTLQNWILDFGRPIVMVRRLNAHFT